MSEMNSKHNRVVWTDVPVADLDRAIAYAGVLGVEVVGETYEGFRFAVIAHDEGNGGCLIVAPEAIAPGKGPTVYFNCDGRIREAAARAGELGGKVLQGVHAIGPHGFRAVVEDSEGNRIALHSNTDA